MEPFNLLSTLSVKQKLMSVEYLHEENIFIFKPVLFNNLPNKSKEKVSCVRHILMLKLEVMDFLTHKHTCQHTPP